MKTTTIIPIKIMINDSKPDENGNRSCMLRSHLATAKDDETGLVYDISQSWAGTEFMITQGGSTITFIISVDDFLQALKSAGLIPGDHK